MARHADIAHSPGEGDESPALALGNLPDHLLLHCLAPLTQEERFRNAALVSKRFHALCLSPPVLRRVAVRAGASGSPLPRYRSLLSFLAVHAAHVHCLELHSYSQSEEEEVAAAVSSCLAACGAAGCLEELTVGLWTPQGSTDSWLPSLTSLRRLRLGTATRPLHLPPGVSRLEALLEAELTGCPLELGYARLPPRLTALCLRDNASTQLPHQLSQLSSLASLELDGIRFARAELDILARLPTLRCLRLPMRPRLSLAGLEALTQLERLVATPMEGPAFNAALGRLTRLTCLALSGELSRFPPTLASLPALQRFWCCSLGRADEHDVSLPHGPWLSSLRWLGLRWRVLQAAPAVLRDAHALEYLSCLDAPRLWDESGSGSDSDGSSGGDGGGSSDVEEGEEQAAAAAAAEELQQLHLDAAAGQGGGHEEEEGWHMEQWRGFWAFVAGHPPLRCLGLDSNEHVAGELLDAVVDLKHARPALQVRRTSRRGRLTFFEEVLTCADIPATSG